MKNAKRIVGAVVLGSVLCASLTGCMLDELVGVALNTRTVKPGERVVLQGTFSKDETWSIGCSPGVASVRLDVQLFAPSGALADAGSFTGETPVTGTGQAGGHVEVVVENDSPVAAAVSLIAN